MVFCPVKKQRVSLVWIKKFVVSITNKTKQQHNCGVTIFWALFVRFKTKEKRTKIALQSPLIALKHFKLSKITSPERQLRTIQHVWKSLARWLGPISYGQPSYLIGELHGHYWPCQGPSSTAKIFEVRPQPLWLCYCCFSSRI